jgi:hypothetical protein
MEMEGEYKEHLSIIDADLIVNSHTFYISIYIPGIDRRYNGEFLRIEKSQINEYIEALDKNWKKYETLSSTLKDEEFRVTGLLNMDITNKGVCFYHYHMLISSYKMISMYIEELKRALFRGDYLRVKLQQILL